MSSVPPPPSGRDEREPAAGERTRASDAGAAAAARRPRWLVAALLLAMVLGTSSWWDGCARIDMYQGDRARAVEQLHGSLEDPSARARAEAAYVRMLEVYGTSRSRTVPLASATFVLGAALLALASRGLGGRRGARAALVQVVSVQAVVGVITYFATRDVREAERSWEHECRVALQDQAFPPEWRARAAAIEELKQRFEAPFGLAFRTVSSALVLVALTRRRTRAFFEAAETPLSER